MKIQELLDLPDKWTTGSRARNDRDLFVEPGSEEAVKWCLMGALDKCYPLNGHARARMAIEHELFKWGWKSIEAFNDSCLTTFEQLREVIIAANV
jgi:hypothetical protein